jgi:hypothetical protein
LIKPTDVPTPDGLNSFINVVVNGPLPPTMANMKKQRRKITGCFHIPKFASIITQDIIEIRHKKTIRDFLVLAIWVTVPQKRTKSIVETIIKSVKDAAIFDVTPQVS